jgi:multicomponent K+:H+ antiporter subunit F
MIDFALVAAGAMLCIALLLSLWRLARGPGVCDRILALDTLTVNVTGLLIVAGIRSGRTEVFEAALLFAVLGFVSTVALARYAERGRISE